MHFLFIAAIFATFLGVSVHAFNLNFAATGAGGPAPKDQPIIIRYNETQANVYSYGPIQPIFNNKNGGQIEFYADIPIVDCQSKNIGIAQFNVGATERNGKLYLQETGTYFFDNTGSSITYNYWYLSSSGNGIANPQLGFANGQVVTALSSGSSGIFAGKQFLITITVAGRIRNIVITKK